MVSFALHNRDCLEVLKEMADDSVDSIITDPPYGLRFMNKQWDYDVPSIDIWKECLRVLKPGGHLLTFAGTRTYHRMVVRIEDAGFEIRDQLAWVYGSGFPKSHDVSKAIDKAAGVERQVVGVRKHPTLRDPNKIERTNTQNHGGNKTRDEWEITEPATDAARQWKGWGTALKPAWEPICLARKPLIGTVAKNVMEHGTGALNIDGCRVPHVTVGNGNLADNPHLRKFINGGNGGNIFPTEAERRVVTPNQQGRWPANLIHDGSEEVVSLFPVTSSGAMKRTVEAYDGESTTSFLRGRSGPHNQHGVSGSAARFFYCAKASRKDRNDGLTVSNKHPTVKPTDLMAYLCRLVTPPGGTVLDPFMGSGSTGKAAIREGFNFIGCEIDEHYCEIARARIEHEHQLRDKHVEVR